MLTLERWFIGRTEVVVSSLQRVVNSLSTQGVQALGVKIWIGRLWVTFVNICAPEGSVSESWLQQLTNTIQHPFLILEDFNQKHCAWGSTFNTLGSEEIFNWLTNNNVCILNTNHVAH